MVTSALAHSVSEACSITHTGRTSLYEAIRSGALRAVKRGRRTLILADDLRRWVEALPPVVVDPSRDHATKEGLDGWRNRDRSAKPLATSTPHVVLRPRDRKRRSAT